MNPLRQRLFHAPPWEPGLFCATFFGCCHVLFTPYLEQHAHRDPCSASPSCVMSPFWSSFCSSFFLKTRPTIGMEARKPVPQIPTTTPGQQKVITSPTIATHFAALIHEGPKVMDIHKTPIESEPMIQLSKTST